MNYNDWKDIKEEVRNKGVQYALEGKALTPDTLITLKSQQFENLLALVWALTFEFTEELHAHKGACASELKSESFEALIGPRVFRPITVEGVKASALAWSEMIDKL